MRTEANRVSDRKRRHEARDKIVAFKTDRGCKDCGIKHPAVLQLHHPNGVKDGLRLTKRATIAWIHIQAELDSCEVLCANCHLIRHYNEQSAFFANERVK